MSLNESKFRRGSWLVTIPLVAMAVVHIVFAYLPGRRLIAELRGQIEYRQFYMSDAAEVSQKLIAAKQELDTVNSYIETWRNSSPVINNLPLLFGNINSLSKKAGAAATRFEPQPIIELAHLRQIPVNMAYTGTFEQIYEFIRTLESMPEVIWINSMRLDKTSQIGNNILSEINLVIFSDNPESSNYADNDK